MGWEFSVAVSLGCEWLGFLPRPPSEEVWRATQRRADRQEQEHVCARARSFSSHDELFGDDTDDWARLMLREEFASVTSCPLDDDERLFAPE